MIRSIAAALPALLMASSVLAADLTLSMGGEAEYDDNAFRQSRNEKDDVFFRLRPGVRVHEDRGDDLNFSLAYELPVEFSVNYSKQLNDIDHIARGSFSYHVNDRVNVTGSDRFGYLRGVLTSQRFDPNAVALGLGIPLVSQERDRATVNDVDLGVSYAFAPRLVGRLRAGHRFFDSERADRSQVQTLNGAADLFYALSAQHQIGGGALFTYQDYEGRPDIPGSATYSYNVFGQWRFTIDETTAFEVSAGPSFLETMQDRAAATSFQSLVPFTLLGGGQVPSEGFYDENGSTLTPGTKVSAGSVLVSAPTNCPVQSTPFGSLPVFPCGQNIIVDPATNPNLVAAIRSAQVPVTNVNPSGSRSSRWTLFADAVLTKRWTPTLASALRYSRSQGNASGLGGTVIRDAVSVSNTWNFLERWWLALRGDWTRQESATDLRQTRLIAATVLPNTLPGGHNAALAGLSGLAFNAQGPLVDIETRRWAVSGRLTHRLFRNTRVYVQVTYDEQTSDRGTAGSSSDFENFLATFGVRHVFEPIKLW